MTRRIFISGTNTDIGKTVITRAIARALVRRGIRVAVIKPVESGAEVQDGELFPADGTALHRAAQMPGPSSQCSKYVFETAVSPHYAALLLGKKVDSKVIADVLDEAAVGADVVLSEGAGGFLVPLAPGLLYGDVIAMSGYELLIVAPNRLGAINTTLLTLEAARHREVHVMGVILNGTVDIELNNRDAIAQFGAVPVLGEFPTAPLKGTPEDDELLADLAELHIDLSAFVP